MTPRTPRPWPRALRAPVSWLLLGALALYLPFALWRHQHLLSGACDLGIFDQAVRGWAFHGWPEVPIKLPGMHHFGDHFMPIFAVLAPLYWLFDTPTTLVVAQPVLLVASALPVYLALRRLVGRTPALLLTAGYLLSYAVQGAVRFPVHEVMFAAPLLAWAVERALAGRWNWATALVCATLLVKEDYGVVVAAFGVWALLARRWRQGAFALVAGVTAFVLVIGLVIPHYAGAKGFSYYHYSSLGGARSLGEMASWALTHPLDTVAALFDRPLKVYTWLLLLVPFGLCAAASPISLLVLPVMLERMLNDRELLWSFTLYYDTPLLPVVLVANVHGFCRLLDWWRARRGRPSPLPVAGRAATVFRWYAATALAITLVIGYWLPVGTWLRGAMARPSEAYQATARAALAQVPAGVAVRASDRFAPWLTPTNRVTLLGSTVEQGDWAILDVARPGCPVPEDEPGRPLVADLLRQGFTVRWARGDVMVLARG